MFAYSRLSLNKPSLPQLLWIAPSSFSVTWRFFKQHDISIIQAVLNVQVSLAVRKRNEHDWTRVQGKDWAEQSREMPQVRPASTAGPSHNFIGRHNTHERNENISVLGYCPTKACNNHAESSGTMWLFEVDFIAGHTVRQASRFHTVTIQCGNFKMYKAQKLLQDFITTYQFSNLIACFSGSSRGNPRQPAQLPQHHACGGTITSYGETIQFFRYAR